MRIVTLGKGLRLRHCLLVKDQFKVWISGLVRVVYIHYWDVHCGRIGGLLGRVLLSRFFGSIPLLCIWTFETDCMLARSLDIDQKSISYAGENVRINNQQDRITLVETKVEDPLIPLDDILGISSR